MAIKDIRDNLRRLKDADPIELAAQVNDWLHESGEAIKLKIEDEVEKAVTKRGFVKRSEFLKLEARINALEGKSYGKKMSASKKSAGSSKSSSKLATAKNSKAKKVSKQKRAK